jgi:DNA-binding transcriptional ArsR family regulator
MPQPSGFWQPPAHLLQGVFRKGTFNTVVYSERKLNDPRAMRAVAHPVRLGILEQLAVHGPMTATELADRLDKTPSNCSWHLRKLAEHGFVEEAERGTGRKRPWRAVSQGMRWVDADESPELARAGEALSQLMIEREVARLARARAMRDQDTPQWREASTSSQSMQWLTADELGEINLAVRDLMMSRIDRFEHPERRPEGARLCAFIASGVPAYDFEPGPGAKGGSGA